MSVKIKTSVRKFILPLYLSGIGISTAATSVDAQLSEISGRRYQGNVQAESDILRAIPEQLKADNYLPEDRQIIVCDRSSARVPTDILHALTISQAIDIAVCRNPQIQLAWGMIKEQAASVGEARAARYPTVSLSAGHTNDDTQYGGTNNPTTALHSNTLSATLNWRLWDAGASAARERAVNAQFSAALAGHDAELQRVINTVVANYFDAQYAHAEWLAKIKAEDIARQTLTSSQRRAASGLDSLTDTLQATSVLAKVLLEKERALGNYRKAMSILTYNLGLSLAYSDNIEDSVGLDEVVVPSIEKSVSLRKNLADWLDVAESHHPSLVMARAKLVAAQEKVKLTVAEGLPSLDLSANYYQNGRPNQGLSPTTSRERIVQLSITFPLFEGFSRKYKIQGANAQVSQREAELRDAELQVSMEVIKAYSDTISALNNLVAAQTLLQSTQNSLLSVQRKYERNANDIQQLLTVQNMLAEAELERIRCDAEWKSARLRLIASAGRFGYKELKMIVPN